MQMLSQSHFLSLNPRNSLPFSSSNSGVCRYNRRKILSGIKSFPISGGIKLSSYRMASNCALRNQVQIDDLGVDESELDEFATVSNKIADAAGEVIRKYFRKSFDILDKEDLSKFFVHFDANNKLLVDLYNL